MKNSKLVYILILGLFTYIVLSVGKGFFLINIFQSLLGLTWSIVVVVIILWVLSSNSKGPSQETKDIFVKVDKDLDFNLLKHISDYDFSFLGGAKEARLLHFQGQGATEENVKKFLANFGVEKTEFF